MSQLLAAPLRTQAMPALQEEDKQRGIVETEDTFQNGDSFYGIDRLPALFSPLSVTNQLLCIGHEMWHKGASFPEVNVTVAVIRGLSLRARLCWLLWGALALPLLSVAQQPFYTDDAEVTPKGKWHFEASNEFDQLRAGSFPNLRQNTANFKFAYGPIENLEVGLDNQLLGLFNGPNPNLPTTAFGFGDLDFSAKYKFHKEKEGSWLPDLAASLNVEFPTGDSSKQLGSGLTDFVINGIAQKSLTNRTKLRLNGGFVFQGNTLTGVIGVRTRGIIYTGGVSIVRAFTPRLQLGAELTGALTSNFQLNRGGQLQNQMGGNYELRKDFTFDFGLTTGYFSTSPRVGGQVGFSINF